MASLVEVGPADTITQPGVPSFVSLFLVVVGILGGPTNEEVGPLFQPVTEFGPPPPTRAAPPFGGGNQPFVTPGFLTS